MRLRKLIAAAGIATTVAGFGLASAGDASAFSADCQGNSHAICLYYNSSSYGYGAYFKQTGNISDYSGYTFSSGLNGSAGAGAAVKNGAAAIDSWYGGNFVVYYNSGYNCSFACQTVSGFAPVTDLNGSLKNNNASGSFN
ncbi:hypothetical protein [Kitasatospora griseola]|uniref:hypothetical protein n=1 Tax=Kitasatospora griseola TaxID=2064 RepID=UPI00382692F8